MDKNSPLEDRIFTQIDEPPLGVRLLRQLRDTLQFLFSGPGDFFRTSLFPGRDWFPGRLAGALADTSKSLVTHPARFVADTLTPDEIALKRRRRLTTILTISVGVHAIVIAGLFVFSMLCTFWGIRVT